MPANGTSPSARRTASRREPSESHRPASFGSAGTVVRTRTSPVVKRTEKAMPASAADLGVLSALPCGRRLGCPAGGCGLPSHAPGSASEHRQPVGDQLDPEDQEQHGHHGVVVDGEPALQSSRVLLSSVSPPTR